MIPDWERDSYRAAMEEMREQMADAARWNARATRAFWTFWVGCGVVLVVEAVRSW